MIYHETEFGTLYHGDCLEVLRSMPDNSVDSVVTDPPYGLSFMGKHWDYDVPSVDIWSECLRVLKPGGHLLSFAGSRTYHRIACAIEDAGFEIRDQIMWIYGSGFPKSLDIGKAIDKEQHKILFSLSELQDKLNDRRREMGLTLKQINIMLGAPENSGLAAHKFCDKTQPQYPTREQMTILDKELSLNGELWTLYDKVEREVIGQGKAGLTAGSIANFAGSKVFDLTAPATDEARQWQGFGTALKPAHEPICVARKPIEGTVAANVLKWGTGGINVDGCRVEFQDDTDKAESVNKNQHADYNSNDGIRVPTKGIYHGDNRPPENYNPTQGRFPANVIHDGSDEVLDGFPDKCGALAPVKSGQKGFGGEIYGKYAQAGDDGATYYNDGLASASRFFYCAKASKAERNMGREGLPMTEYKMHRRPDSDPDKVPMINQNYHPTVKPIALMRYLCRLVTPPNGIVLDPFLGSGTTAIAAVQEGFQYIGIEREAEYCEIARHRIDAVSERIDTELDQTDFLRET
jgi:DNA modification methylase